MPKMKSNRGAKKRFKSTGSGRVKRFHAFSSHKFTCKTRKQKRGLRSGAMVDDRDVKRVRILIQA